MILKLETERDNFKEAIEELKVAWLNNLLESIGIEPYSGDTHSADYVEYLLSKRVEIISYPSFGGLQVLLKKEVVGEWGGPEFFLKKDSNGRYYYYIEIECSNNTDDFS